MAKEKNIPGQNEHQPAKPALDFLVDSSSLKRNRSRMNHPARHTHFAGSIMRRKLRLRESFNIDVGSQHEPVNALLKNSDQLVYRNSRLVLFPGGDTRANRLPVGRRKAGQNETFDRNKDQRLSKQPLQKTEVRGKPVAPRPGRKPEAGFESAFPKRRRESPLKGRPKSTYSTQPVSRHTATETGRPLPVQLRERFGPMMMMDLASVRIHTGAETGRRVRKIRADAVTHENRIYFAPGKFAPETRTGSALLIHELTHVRQNIQTSTTANRTSASQLHDYEKEAQHNEKVILQKYTYLKAAPSLAATPARLPSPQQVTQPIMPASQEKSIHPGNMPPMPALSNRNLDTSLANDMQTANDTMQDNDAPVDKHALLDEVYRSLMLRLEVEKERTGD